MQRTFVPRRSPRSRAAIPAVALATVFVLAGCAPGGSTATVETGNESTSFPSEPITLIVADYELSPGSGDAIIALEEAFTREHPNVTIERQYQTLAAYQKSINLQLSSQSPPDVLEVPQGHAGAVSMVAANLLRPLDGYSDLYGWKDLYPGVLSQQNQVADGGEYFGSGNLYAVSLGGNMVGAFYNKALLAQLGIEVESLKTLDDFEAAMAKAKAAGIQPNVQGDLGGGPASHIAGALVANYAASESAETLNSVRDWIYDKPGSDIVQPAAIDAFTTYQRWLTEGYINTDISGTSFTDAAARFTSGESLFYIEGSWMQAPNDAAMGDNVGFMLLPPAKAGGSPASEGGTAGAFGISAKSKNPDAAAAFIDFMANGENSKVISDGGYLPIIPGYVPPETGASQDDLIVEWNRMNAADGMGLFLDWSTNSMGTAAYFPGLQDLAASQVTPEELLTKMQENWTQSNK